MIIVMIVFASEDAEAQDTGHSAHSHTASKGSKLKRDICQTCILKQQSKTKQTPKT